MLRQVHASSSSRLLLTVLLVAAFSLGAASVRAATLTVDTTSDTANATNDCGTGAGTSCSLRDAITQANTDGSGDTIVFKNGLTGTITLGSSLPAISVGVTITGPGANMLTIDGGGAYQAMSVNGSGITVSISGLTFANGVSSTEGGAIYLVAGTLTVSDCVFSGNSAQFGGAIAGDGTQLTVTGSTITQNSATAGGGAIYSRAGTLTATNNTFYNNSASSGSSGGAIYAAATASATNNTFYGNSANHGGAIVVTSTGSLTSDNNLFAGNTANGGGGAIYNGNGGTANADYNVYYNNLAGTTKDDCNSCTSNTNPTTAPSNPLALPLGNYGGPTQTYLPQPGSAAICAGSASLATAASLTNDQRGFAVAPSYSQCASTAVDAGAVQTNYIQVTNTGDSNGASCPDAAKCSLRAAISLAAGQGDIDFNSSVTSVTLSSTGTTLTLALPASGVAGVNIIGPAANKLTVGGSTPLPYGVFQVNANVPAVLYGMTISFGTATGNGGGINNLGNLTLLASAVTGNDAINGGGVYNSGVLLALKDTINGNGALNGGGIYNTGTLEIEESTFYFNKANNVNGTPQGGGIYSSGSLVVVNSTIAGNITANGSTSDGGGVYIGGGSASLANSIVSGNTVYAGGSDANIGGTFTDNGGNVIGGSTNADTSNLGGGTGAAITLSNLGYNPSTASLKTMTPLPGSAAICAGTSANLLAGVTSDERGQPNTNTTYSGYSTASPCVDAGAVQTNYSMSFTTNPPSSVTVDQGFGAGVTLDESGHPFSASSVNIPLTLSSGTLSGTATQGTSSGVATYSGLSATLGTGVTLNASIPLTTAPLSLSAASASFNVNAAPTQVGLVTSSSSSTVNQSLTFTATISPNVTNLVAAADVIPMTGTVAYSVGGQAITNCGSQAITYNASTGTATATCLTAALPAGSPVSITAIYTPGDANYVTSPASPAVTVTMAPASTTTAVVSSTNNTSNVGDSVTFTATVTASAGAGVPLSGTVTFTDNGNAITTCGTSGAVTVGSWSSTTGTATAACTTDALTGGNHTIVATYGSDTNYTGSSANLTQTVSSTASSTTVASSVNPSQVNQSVTFTATVSPSGKSVKLTGTVSFTDNGNPIGCTVGWSSKTGIATCSTSTLTLGTHAIVATYSGDSSYGASSSTALSQVVGQASTSLALASSPNPSTLNGSVTLTATVTTNPSGGTALSGTVAFTDNGNAISTCTAVSPSVSGVAACTTSSLKIGTHTIVATYGNDTNYQGSNNSITQTVNAAPTSVTLISSGSPSTVNQSITFTATVAGGGGTTPYSGTMTFAVGSTTICSQAVNTTTGVASCNYAALTAGSHTIKATYAGDSNYSTSSTTLSQSVNPAQTTLALSSSANPSVIGDPVTFTATVSPSSGPVLLSGSVTFKDGNSAISGCSSAIPVDATGVATCTTSSLSSGKHSISAAYAGDSNFQNSGSSLTQTVEDFAITTSSTLVEVTQSFTSTSDPFSPQTLTISSNSPSGFSGSVSLDCSNVTVVAAPSGATPPVCTLSTTTITLSNGTTQQSVTALIDATNATPGTYSVSVSGTDQNTNLSRSTNFTVIVRALSAPLTVISGSTTGNTTPASFFLPANVGISSLRCLTVTGTGLPPLGLDPSSISIGCSFNPNSVASDVAPQSANVTVTITTGGTTTTASVKHNSNILAAGLLGLPIFGLLGLLRTGKSRNSAFFRLMAVLAFIASAYQVVGCGGSFQKPMASGGQTPPGSYSLLIQGTGTDGQQYQAVIQVNVTL